LKHNCPDKCFRHRLQAAGVFRQKQHHALSNKALKKRERHAKHVANGVLFNKSESTETTAENSMETDAFEAAGNALKKKAKKTDAME
jgi:hypothetical protein